MLTGKTVDDHLVLAIHGSEGLLTSSVLPSEAFRSRAEVLAWQEMSSPGGPGETGGTDALAQALYELRVHQIELEMQNEELRRTQVELGESLAHYVNFCDLAQVGYCTVTEKGLIKQANLRS